MKEAGKVYTFVRQGHEHSGEKVFSICRMSSGFKVARTKDIAVSLRDSAKIVKTWFAKAKELE